MLSTANRTLLAVVLIVAVGSTAYAQDVVEVTNGDRIKGTVRGLARAKLSFGTDAAGTISIAWNQVVTLTTTQALDVELSSGVRYHGTISSPSSGQLIVETTSGPTPPIDMKEVIRITPIGASLPRAHDGIDRLRRRPEKGR